jgi:hypothetical protein
VGGFLPGTKLGHDTSISDRLPQVRAKKCLHSGGFSIRRITARLDGVIELMLMMVVKGQRHMGGTAGSALEATGPHVA